MAKYTDEQIKSALLCHTDVSFDKCGICPMQSDTACRSEMCRSALDLINRQEAEIERLKSELKSYKQIDKYILDRLFDGKDYATKEAFDYAYQKEVDRLCNIEPQNLKQSKSLRRD